MYMYNRVVHVLDYEPNNNNNNNNNNIYTGGVLTLSGFRNGPVKNIESTLLY